MMTMMTMMMIMMIEFEKNGGSVFDLKGLGRKAGEEIVVDGGGAVGTTS